MGTKKVKGGGSRKDKPLYEVPPGTDETDITILCRAWAHDALISERADIGEFQDDEDPTSEQMKLMRHISQALIKLEAAHTVGQVLEVLEAHSSVMAQTMVEAMGLGG